MSMATDRVMPEGEQRAARAAIRSAMWWAIIVKMGGQTGLSCSAVGRKSSSGRSGARAERRTDDLFEWASRQHPSRRVAVRPSFLVNWCSGHAGAMPDRHAGVEHVRANVSGGIRRGA
jgi:hypothetical protein